MAAIDRLRPAALTMARGHVRGSERRTGFNDRHVDASDRAKSSTWLAFLERRLLIARDLLKPNGAVMEAIGDEEHHRLRMLLDQVLSVGGVPKPDPDDADSLPDLLVDTGTVHDDIERRVPMSGVPPGGS